jgi:hypothetical protein
LRSGDQALGDSAQLASGIDVDLVETIGHSGSFPSCSARIGP